MIEVTIQVEGMMCEMCESHVCDQLRKVPGVKKAKASHYKNTATAIAEEGVDVDALKAGIESQGYRTGEVKVAPYEKKGLFGLFKKKK
ncbi:MAG: cation transporter [Bacilli bacterium]|nr:cation transporter [Bacilli bacterium]